MVLLLQESCTILHILHVIFYWETPFIDDKIQSTHVYISMYVAMLHVATM